MVGTLDFFVSFIISLITAQRWAGFTAVKLTGKLFHVWTLCSDAALSTCLFTLLLNTYLFHEKTLNTGADKDEKRRQFFFFLFLCVSNREPPIFSFIGLKKDRDGSKWDNQCCMVWVSIIALHIHGRVHYGNLANRSISLLNHQKWDTSKQIQKSLWHLQAFMLHKNLWGLDDLDRFTRNKIRIWQN